jgi:hypothetical protein
MTKAQAEKLVKMLETSKGVPDHVVAFVDDEGENIVFASDLTGSHSLSLAVSDRARVLAHWAGFVANNVARVSQ